MKFTQTSLLKSSPYAILALAALAAGPAAAQTAPGRVEGLLTVVWADPHPSVSGGATRFDLTTAEGKTIQLDIAVKDRSAAYAAFGKRVAVQGRARQGAGGAERMAVESLSLLEPAQSPRVSQALTTRRVLYILLKFAGDAQTPHAPLFYKALTNPKTPDAALKIPATINGYFDRTSWGSLQWSADVAGTGGLAATGWLTLPKPKSGYANCGFSQVCFDYRLLVNDAMALATRAGVNVSVYNNVNFVFNNDLDCCAWGGGFVYNNKVYGGTWEPPWGQETGVYVHEMGHSLGLPHSGWVYHAYDSPWDDMSRQAPAQRVQCGTYISANDGNRSRALGCTEPGAGYITPHKDYLGWLPAANKVVVSSVSTRTVTLAANSEALGAGVKMIKICLPGLSCTGSTARYLTVEARVKTALYERGMPGEGIVIHDFMANRQPIGNGNSCFFNTQSGWAVPVDATPADYRGAPNCDAGGRTYPNYALFNAQFGVGKVYTRTDLGVKVEVLSKTGSTFSVRVTRSK